MLLLCAYLRLHTSAGDTPCPTDRGDDQTHLPLGGSEAALLHLGSLLQRKHQQLEGTGQNNTVFTTHSQSKK